MDQTMLFYTAIAVFSLMSMGLALTVWEFSRGAPHKQSQAAGNDQGKTRPIHPAQKS
jgi:hypothetical protein